MIAALVWLCVAGVVLVVLLGAWAVGADPWPVLGVLAVLAALHLLGLVVNAVSEIYLLVLEIKTVARSLELKADALKGDVADLARRRTDRLERLQDTED